MPTGTPLFAFIDPYNIRVDDFASTKGLTEVPALYLLSHTHTDHLNGLNAKSFAAPVICSKDAKVMLLRQEPYFERAMYDSAMRPERGRPFSHLRVTDVDAGQGRDLLVRGFLCVSTFTGAERDVIETYGLECAKEVHVVGGRDGDDYAYRRESLSWGGHVRLVPSHTFGTYTQPLG